MEKLYTVHALNHRLYLHHVLGVFDSLEKAKEIVVRNIHAGDKMSDSELQEIEFNNNSETIADSSLLIFDNTDVYYEIDGVRKSTTPTNRTLGLVITAHAFE